MGRIEKIIRRVYKKIGSRTGFLVSDEKYIKNEWKLNMDYPLDLASPKTFNEKLQWLKLHDRKDIYTTMDYDLRSVSVVLLALKKYTKMPLIRWRHLLI